MTNIENRLGLGVLVNPFAGVDDAVGLKGSDGSDTREEALQALAAELGERAHVLPCNLGDPEAVEHIDTTV